MVQIQSTVILDYAFDNGIEQVRRQVSGSINKRIKPPKFKTKRTKVLQFNKKTQKFKTKRTKVLNFK